jgi:mono/diheme cytochrome c family protein
MTSMPNRRPLGTVPLPWELLVALIASTLFSPLAQAADASDHVSFNRQIEPLLSENCYHCHGPDSGTRKPKKNPLRLDREKEALAPRDGDPPVILKGNPLKSELVRRIRTKDEEDIMPPPSEHKTLKASEIALIEKWIAEGAHYEAHWAFIPPVKAPLPPEPNGWAKNQIDYFVAAALREKGLQPNGEEDKARLFRRLSFDLTGLPPDERELKAFLRDRSSDAYLKAVNRMLDSDESAENFTRHWLDTVRYADTQGIHHDHLRTIWPYRDWVISAFRKNMPFDEFTVEQIAGDLLPDATLDQRVASGYNRLLPTTGEGGAIPEEYEAIYAKDRTETTSAVWLGLTTGCATCHDHKFDPISTKEFYSLTSFFRNNTMRALDSGSTGNNAPMLFVPAQQDRDRWPELEVAIAAQNAKLNQRKKESGPEFDHWIATQQKQPLKLPPNPKPFLSLQLTEITGVAAGVAGGKPISWLGSTQHVAGPFGPAPKVEGAEPVPGATPSVPRDGQASYGAFVYVEDKPSGTIFSRMDRSAGFRGWDLFLDNAKPVVHIIDQWPDAALKVTAKETLSPGRWHHVMAVFDGTKKGAEAITLFVDGIKTAVDVSNNKLGTNIVADVPFRLGGRTDKDGTGDVLKDGKVYLQDVRFYEAALSAEDVGRIATVGLVQDYLSKSVDQRDQPTKDRLLSLYLAGFDEPTRKMRTELDRLDAEQKNLRDRGATTLVMEEKKDSKPVAHVLIRGSYSNKGEEVGPATPAALPPFPPYEPRNRLGLAKWIVSRDHPLTARVTVNRIWSYLFGTGLVETTEDFGVMGARPANQDLLDWMAVDFIDSGWNFRRLVQTMVMSATYRQSPLASPEKLEKDPSNRLLSRGPRYRLDAEQIRDQALAAGGVLVEKVGGPPVKPYQPEGLWETVAMKDSNTRYYKQDAGEGLYRRSLYTFWKRVSPPPSMEILNAPSREVFCTRRDRTDTPLQALVTMNDPQFVEAARSLATRAIQSSKNPDKRLDVISLSLLARTLKPDERSIVNRMLDTAAAAYAKNPAAAGELVEVGDSKAPQKLKPEELAAWTLVASQIMNLDESLTK